MWFLAFGACDFESLLPPLTLDGLVVRELTYDRLDADLEFLVDEGSDPEGVSDMEYAVEVEDDAVAAGDSTDTEIDGNVILAPVEVTLGELPAWGELVGRDGAVPFTVTGHYAYQGTGVHLDFTLVEQGELPAPRAPELDAVAIEADPPALVLSVVNRDPTPIGVRFDGVVVRIDGADRSAGSAVSMTVAGDGAATISVPLDAAVGGDTVAVELDGEATVDTAFGPIPWAVARTFDDVRVDR